MFQIKVAEEVKIHIFMFHNFFPKIVPFIRRCRKMWWSQRPQMTIWRCVECQISTATRAQTRDRAIATTTASTRIQRARTHTHIHTQKYVTLIAFPQQQWFHKRASTLRFTYIACLLFFFENHALYEFIWKNKIQPNKSQMHYNMAQKKCDLHAG